MQNNDKFKKKSRRDDERRRDGETDHGNVRTDDAKRSTDDLAMNRPRDVARRTGVQPVGPVRQRRRLQRAQTPPRPPPIGRPPSSLRAAGGGERYGGPGPGHRHPATDRPQATRNTSARALPLTGWLGRRRRSHSRTHDHRVPRHTLPSVDAVPSWVCRARLWVRARSETGVRARSAAVAAAAVDRFRPITRSPGPGRRRQTDACRAHHRTITEKPIPHPRASCGRSRSAHPRLAQNRTPLDPLPPTHYRRRRRHLSVYEYYICMRSYVFRNTRTMITIFFEASIVFLNCAEIIH